MTGLEERDAVVRYLRRLAKRLTRRQDTLSGGVARLDNLIKIALVRGLAREIARGDHVADKEVERWAVYERTLRNGRWRWVRLSECVHSTRQEAVEEGSEASHELHGPAPSNLDVRKLPTKGPRP